MAFSPLQTSFAGGELSPRLLGRVDAEVYRRGLGTCENFEILPQGGLRKRAGFQYIAGLGSLAYTPRLIPFRVAGSADDYCIVLKDQTLEIYSATTGARVAFFKSRILNGTFDSDFTSWTTTGRGGGAVDPVVEFERYKGTAALATNPCAQDFAATVGVTYRVCFRARGTVASEKISIHGTDGIVAWNDPAHLITLSTHFQDYQFSFVHAAGANATVTIEGGDIGSAGTFYVDNVVVTDPLLDEAATELTTPWTDDQLGDVKWSAEPTKNRIVFTHPDVPPQVLTYIPLVSGGVCFDFYQAMFGSPPEEWYDGNYPGAVEAGFQGRLWFAGSASDPSTVWYSHSGESFNFLTGVNADDASSFIVSTKGRLQWIQGQKVLLAGDDVAEHSAQGSSQIIAPGDIDVRDESAFGSGPVQALHIGDQVLYVTRDQRHIRALSYSKDENAWLSRAITFLAEHITTGGVDEIHFARNPYPCIVGVKQGDPTELILCTYDRGEQVVAWGKAATSGTRTGTPSNGTFYSAAVLETDSGAEVWAAISRLGAFGLERMPLYETGRQYLDSWVTATKSSSSLLTGLTHLNGWDVSVLMDGVLMPSTYTVSSGQITSSAAFTGSTFVVGLAFTATAETLPLQIGNPKGSAANAKRRFAKIAAILSNSALPLVNGVRLNADGDASPYTGVYDAAPPGGWQTKGVITITQDQPSRTEILAIGGVASASEV